MDSPNLPGPLSWTRLPGLSSLQDLVGVQVQAMSQLPTTVADLSRAVSDLTGAIEAARSTIAKAQEVSERLERASRELEQPVRALRPGIERLARVLDDPAIDEVPRTVQMIGDVVEVINSRLRRTQDHSASLSATARSAVRVVRGLPTQVRDRIRFRARRVRRERTSPGGS